MAKKRTKTTTRITILRDISWEVPRGFGVQYRDAARDQLVDLSRAKPGEVIGRIRDLLLLIGYEASIAVVADWDLRKRVEAEVYALNVHLRASDNPIQAHPKPAWLPEPWKGPRYIRASGEDTPQPTELTNDVILTGFNTWLEKKLESPSFAQHYRKARKKLDLKA